MVRERIHLEKHIFSEMKQFMNAEEFSDVEIKIGDEVFKCHKIVLASWSKYFHALFGSGMKEAALGVVELEAIEAGEFKDILKVMYTGQFEVKKENIQGLLYAASYLQMNSFEEECINWIINTFDRLDIERNLQYVKMSGQLNLESLAIFMLINIACEVEMYERFDGFYELMCLDDMMKLLWSEDLSFESEDEVCAAIFTWIDFDPEGRKQYFKELIKWIRYLALSDIYMKDVFLEHGAVKENVDLEHVRSECLAYLSKPWLQFEYIGEPKASHRSIHDLVDVIAVCNLSYLAFIKREDSEDGIYKYYNPAESLVFTERFDFTEKIKAKSMSCCNYGRSEILLSDGKRIYHFNGETGAWTHGPKHLPVIPLDSFEGDNCILFDKGTGNIYNVIVRQEMVFIEKCKFDFENETCSFEMEYTQEIENSPASSDLRPCAFLIDGDIFFLQSGVAPKQGEITVLKYCVGVKSLSFVGTLPPDFINSVAVTHKDLVFLVSGDMNIYRVSDKGQCIEKYGQISHDKETRERLMGNFGACILNTKLIAMDFRIVVDYDLDSHMTEVGSVQFPEFWEYGDTSSGCLKLTISRTSLRAKALELDSSDESLG